MKSFLLVVLVSWLFGPRVSVCQTRSDGIRSIEISYIDWYAETVVPMACEELISPVNNPSIGRIIIQQDQEFFRRISRGLRRLTPAKTNTRPDARIVIKIYYISNKESVVCVGINKALVFNSKAMEYSDDFEKLIRSAIPISYFKE
ncbi:MAG: hypothetical protein WAO19_04265 [Candidatus Kryptoniota bacterium]